MHHDPNTPCTAFHGSDLLTHGILAEVAPAVLEAGDGVLVFDDASGRVIDLDPRDWTGTQAPPAPPETRRGRPKLGVVAREVTLLPRHWDWLALQKGGASAALRRLVDEARKADDGRTARRAAQDATYRVLHALAGDWPHYEEVTRALFSGDLDGFAAAMADWPEDLRTYALRLAHGDTQ